MNFDNSRVCASLRTSSPDGRVDRGDLALAAGRRDGASKPTFPVSWSTRPEPGSKSSDSGAMVCMLSTTPSRRRDQACPRIRARHGQA